MKQYKSIETDRLILRPTHDGDASFIHQLMNTPKWLKFIGDRNVKTVNDAKDYIKEKMQSQLERLGYSNYTIIRKSDNIKIGTCGLYDRDGIQGIDIGFSLLPAYEKQGYAYESAIVLRNVAFSYFGIKTIYAITTKENISSQKLLEKLGLSFSSIKKLPGDNEELLLYKIDKKEQV